MSGLIKRKPVKGLIWPFLLAICFFLMQLAYPYIIIAIYESQGFIVEFNHSRFVICNLLIFPMSLLPFLINKSTYKEAILVIIHLVFFQPNAVLYIIGGASPGIVWLHVFFLILVSLNLNLKKITVTKFDDTKYLKYWVLGIFVLLVFFIMDYGLVPSLKSLSFGKEQYDIRKELDINYTGYLLSPVCQFLIPFLIVNSINKGKWILAMLFTFVLVYIFMLNPQKTIIFNLTIVAFYLIFSSYLTATRVTIIGFVAILAFCFFEVFIIGPQYDFISSYITRRFLFLPAQLNTCYFHIFEGQPVKLAHSVLSWMYDYPYALEPAQKVAIECLGKNSNANNGIISDGYMNFGYIGSLIWIVGASGIIHFLNNLKLDASYFSLTFIMLMFFKSSGILTSFLSHGVWFFLILAIFFIPIDKKGLTLKE